MKKTAIVALIFVFLLGLAGCGQQVINQEDYSYYAVREEMPVLTQDSGPAQGGRLRLFMTTPDSLNPIYTFNPYISDSLSIDPCLWRMVRKAALILLQSPGSSVKVDDFGHQAS